MLPRACALRMPKMLRRRHDLRVETVSHAKYPDMLRPKSHAAASEISCNLQHVQAVAKGCDHAVGLVCLSTFPLCENSLVLNTPPFKGFLETTGR